MTFQSPHGGKLGKDPKQKKLPRTWGKRRANSDPTPYLKIMSKLMSRRGA